MPDEPKQDLNVPPVQPQTPPTWSTPEVTQPTPEAEQQVSPEDVVPEFEIEPATGPASTPVNETPVTSSTEAPVSSPFTPFGETSPATTPAAPGVDLSASLASEIASTATPTAATTLVTPPKKKSKKPIIIGGIIALVLGVFVGAGAFAYTIYQNPQKVIADALISAFTAKSAEYTGTVTIDSNELKATVKLSGKGNEKSGALNAEITLGTTSGDITLTGDGIISSTGDLYVKLTNLGSLGDSLASLLEAQTGAANTSTLIDKLVKKVDGTWIKVANEDLKSLSESLATSQSCFTKVSEKYKNDSSVLNEIGTIYQKNPFIVVDKELGVVNGSVGYKLKVDDTKTRAFAESLKTTKVYKDLNDCDETFTLDVDALMSEGEVGDTYEVWATQWTHQLTKFGLKSTSGGATIDATVSTELGKSVSIDIPSETTTLAQLSEDLQAILTSNE